MKGADTVVFERLSPNGQTFRDITLRHLEDFATEGLRTLCCAVSVIPEDVYNEWKDTYHKGNITHYSGIVSEQLHIGTRNTFLY